MANQAETCRQKANECARLARYVADFHGRVVLKETATLWRQIAHSMETHEDIERDRAARLDLIFSTQAPRANQPADLAMTLANMRDLGVHGLHVVCRSPACRHEMTFSTDDYTGDTELSWFRARMICAKCGAGRLEVQPDWHAQSGIAEQTVLLASNSGDIPSCVSPSDLEPVFS
jgi:hypothetical protein